MAETETFNEPYVNWYIFSVEKAAYTSVVDFLDLEGISYVLAAERPSRADLLSRMQ